MYNLIEKSRFKKFYYRKTHVIILHMPVVALRAQINKVNEMNCRN